MRPLPLSSIPRQVKLNVTLMSKWSSKQNPHVIIYQISDVTSGRLFAVGRIGGQDSAVSDDALILLDVICIPGYLRKSRMNDVRLNERIVTVLATKDINHEDEYHLDNQQQTYCC